MTEENLYLLINAGVLPAWALLFVVPRAEITRKFVHSGLYPIAYGALYAAFLSAALFFGRSSPDAGMSTLSGVSAIFSHPNGVLTGWTHYLVFDLFIGAWISRDAIRRGISHIFILPALFFSLMFGPIGLLIYFVLRFALGKGGFSLSENSGETAP